jgi:cell division septation protein DedD
MGKNKPIVFSPKKGGSSDNRKAIVIIELVVLAALVIFILVYKEKRVIKTIDMSTPSPMVAIVKKETDKGETKDKTAKVKKEEEAKEHEAVAKKTALKDKTAKEKTTEEKKKATAEKAKKKGAYLQLGAFAMKENFEKLKKKIKDMGYPIDVKTIKKKVSAFKVTLGRFSSQENAKDALEEVKSLDYDPEIIDLGDGKYEVSIKSIFYKSKLAEIKDKLAKNNIKVIIKEMNEISDVFVLRVGPYDSSEKALEVKRELIKKGFKEPYLFNQ